MADVILPELGEGIRSAKVACWHVQVGDSVKRDDDVVELVADKATFNVPSPADGAVKEILVTEGQEADIGSTLARIE